MDARLMLTVVVLSVLAVVMIASYIADYRCWNHGTAPDGQPWIRFDTDSSGCRGYRDTAGDVHIWIGWPVD